MECGICDKIKELLEQEYGFKIFDIIASYFDFDKSYMAFIYWKTNKELELITEEVKQGIKNLIIDYLKKRGFYPDEVEELILYFDSDENVQEKYDGNYFYATR